MNLQEHKYLIGFNNNEHENVLRKLYHQLPTKKEIEMLVELLYEAVVDNITQQVERIK